MNIPNTKQVHTKAYFIGYATLMHEICVTVDVVAVAQNGNYVHYVEEEEPQNYMLHTFSQIY